MKHELPKIKSFFLCFGIIQIKTSTSRFTDPNTPFLKASTNRIAALSMSGLLTIAGKLPVSESNEVLIQKNLT